MIVKKSGHFTVLYLNIETLYFSKIHFFFVGSGSGGVLMNDVVSIASEGAEMLFVTAFTNPCSIYRINMLSRFQTPVVHMARGPGGIIHSPLPAPVFSTILSLAKRRIAWERIRFASTTSVNIRSPTTISS